MGSKKNNRSCRPTFRVSKAGHLLRVERSSEAGSYLASKGKAEKNKRLSKGCLNGAAKRKSNFKLSAKQKSKLPLSLQRAILRYHRNND